MGRLNKKDFMKRMAQIIERIRNEVQPFEDTSPAAVEARKAQALTDDLYFAKTYFPHECKAEFAPWHRDMMSAVDVKNKIVAVYGSRGCAKTSLPGKIKRIKRTVFRQHRYCIILSETAEQATERCAEIRAEFEANARLISDFGDLRTFAPWEFGYFKLSNSVVYRAFGWRSRFRSRRDMAARPDDIYGDDYEDSQTKYNLDIVKKKYKKLKEDILGCTNLKDYWFTYIGNYFSVFSVLNELINDKEVIKHKYLIDRTGECDPTWPDMYSRKTLQDLKKTMGSVSYAIEIMQQPRDEDEQTCKDEWFREWKNSDWDKKPHVRIGFLDPSMRKGEQNDYKALVCIRVYKNPYKILTDRTWIRHCSVGEMIETIFRLYREEKLDILGIEGNVVREYIEELINKKASEVSWHPHIKYIDHTTSKEPRLTSETSDIENGIVLFQKTNSDQHLLIEQWKYLFQPGMHDDGPDAHAAAIVLSRIFTAGVKFHRVSKPSGIGALFKKGAW